ncbi:MAG: hypothetical protein AAFU79_34575 [Myxococcota bacterium]
MPPRHWLLLAYTLLAAVAVSVPALANLLGPVLGVPSAIAWAVGWVSASFFVLLGFHLLDGGERLP